VKRGPGGQNRLTIDSDAIWRNRGLTWAGWARELGAHPDSICRAARAQGWARNDGGEVTAAPCKVCERSTPLERLDAHRVCLGCRITGDADVARYHAERARRRPHLYPAGFVVA
jgi:hypothetical protein